MSNNVQIEAILGEEIAEVTAKLQQANTIDEAEEGSNLTGIEVLVFLAGKVVVPIFCGFVSRVLYEKYADLSTKVELDEAKAALTEGASSPVETIPVERVRVDAVQRLTTEGVPQDVAEGIVDEVIFRCNQRFPQAKHTPSA